MEESPIREAVLSDCGLSYPATNNYILKELIGSGGMGTVYRALDVQLRREVALKVLKSNDPDMFERFLREREITAELDHPNFVRVLTIGYMSGPDGSFPFYTMPFIRGLTLEQLIVRRNSAGEEGEKLRREYPMGTLLQILRQVCLTIQSAHDKSIVHRDLKPSNIILGPHGDVYVTDLGLAKRFRESGDTNHFEEHIKEEFAKGLERDLTNNAALGTPYYMAPEQILTPRKVDHRADVFGMGGLLYFILAGKKPEYVEPFPSRDSLLERRAVIHDRLRWHADAYGGMIGLLVAPRAEFSPEIQAMLREYDDIEGILNASEYHRFWMIMKDCRILPPSHVSIPGERDPIDPAIEAICMKALSRRIEDRYESCRAMALELQQYLEGRRDRILKRQAADLGREPSKRTNEAALRNYEQAELELCEAIVEREKLGRMGLEEKLDLFDLLIGKARLCGQRGDDDTIVGSLSRAEPIIETTLAVVQGQFIQLLLAKGNAQLHQGKYDEAQRVLARALEMSRTHERRALLLDALRAYGTACSLRWRRTKEVREFHAARNALRERALIAEELEDPDLHLARIDLALLLLKSESDRAEGALLLDELRRRTVPDRAAQAALCAAFAERRLAEGDPQAAIEEAQRAIDLAEEADAQVPMREAQLILGKAWHYHGDPRRRAQAFQDALRSRHTREPSMYREIIAFCAEHGLDGSDLT